MNEMNEKSLHAWRPRRPSARLKRRILQLAGEGDLLTARWLWSGLAPTMACVLLTVMAFSHDGGGLDRPTPMALILHNQNTAAYATGGAQTEQNHLAAVTFGWTNDSVFNSSIPFTPTTNLTN